uniref:Odorant receptor 2 n=1 Tax=Macrocentrus cingulum TaxID=535359 RepID=A0A0H3U5B1_9HYME|nr:odorant receptor 2 [Macrocentrus cingulum]
MELLKVSFTVLQLSGFWCPVTWSGWKMWLYKIYTILVIFTLYSVTISQLIELLRSIDDAQEFIKNSLILLTTTNACAKVANILQKRSDILKLVDMLQSEPCCPCNDTEHSIQNRFNHIISRNSLLYTTLTEVSVFFVALGTILSDTPQRRLAFKA